MPINTVRVPSFMGGVSKVSMAQRSAIEMEAMENLDVDLAKGVTKRPGTEHVEPSADGDVNGCLPVVKPTDDAHIFWINRSATERFVGIINPDADAGGGSEANIIQMFNVVTGAEVPVKILDPTLTDGTEIDLNAGNAQIIADYLESGDQTPQQRFRTLTVEDGTFILNRTVLTAPEGADITYLDSSGTAESDRIRNQNHIHNVTAWSDFTHPPPASEIATYPTRATLVAGGNQSSDAIWYARDDDVGLPQGFYWATSATQPPWFERLPTEQANSFIKRETMPLLMKYVTTGTTRFVIQVVDWEPRKSGDSGTNPGPTFLTNAIDDIAFHQGRLWFASGERIVSSRAGDIFNLWIDSVSLVSDADPIDDAIQGTRISNIRLLESFRESLIMLTDGARQVELRANGPITPQSYQMYTSTDIFAANYVEPTRLGSSMYFAGERDASNLVWEYSYSPDQVSNIANDLTARVHGYIPAEAHLMKASAAHDQLYILSLADPDAIYVNTTSYNGGERVLNSWFRWVYAGVDKIRSIEVFDDYLYLLVERTLGRDTGDSTYLFLERQPLGQPTQDTEGSQTLNFATRVDRKVAVNGDHMVEANETAFILPYDGFQGVYQVVAGPKFDTENEKAAGSEVPVVYSGVYTDTVVGSAGSTNEADHYALVVVRGDWSKNADGVASKCYVGLKYDSSVTLSEPFARSTDGAPIHGNNHLMRMRVRHRDTGGYSAKVTPDGRATQEHKFFVPVIGSTGFDSTTLEDFGEFQFKVMAHARNTTIQLSNDSPFPSTWIDADFDTTFVPSYSPVR